MSSLPTPLAPARAPADTRTAAERTIAAVKVVVGSFARAAHRRHRRAAVRRPQPRRGGADRRAAGSRAPSGSGSPGSCSSCPASSCSCIALARHAHRHSAHPVRHRRVRHRHRRPRHARLPRRRAAHRRRGLAPARHDASALASSARSSWASRSSSRSGSSRHCSCGRRSPRPWFAPPPSPPSWAALTLGLGAAILSRAGTHRRLASGSRPVELAAWQTPTPVTGVVAARRPVAVAKEAPMKHRALGLLALLCAAARRALGAGRSALALARRLAPAARQRAAAHQGAVRRRTRRRARDRRPRCSTRMHLRYDELRAVAACIATTPSSAAPCSGSSRAATRSATSSSRHEDSGELRLALPRTIPLDLDLEFGGTAGDAGARRARAAVRCVSSAARRTRRSPSRRRIARTCASSTSTSARRSSPRVHLANANADLIRVRGGVGIGRPRLRRHVDARPRSVDAGSPIGKLTLRVPDDVGVRLEVQRVAAGFDHEGLVKRDDGWYSTNWDTAPHKLHVRAETVIGQIEMQRRRTRYAEWPVPCPIPGRESHQASGGVMIIKGFNVVPLAQEDRSRRSARTASRRSRRETAYYFFFSLFPLLLFLTPLLGLVGNGQQLMESMLVRLLDHDARRHAVAPPPRARGDRHLERQRRHHVHRRAARRLVGLEHLRRR